MEIKPGENPTTIWGRWVVTLIAVVATNVGTMAYMSGTYTKQIENNVLKIQDLERAVREAPTRNEWSDIKGDLKEIKADIKELNRRK